MGTTTLLRGVVEGDREAVETGLDDPLARHRERVDDGDHRGLPTVVFAAEPTALTLIAWERGLEYEFESRFVPLELLWETLPKLTD